MFSNIYSSRINIFVCSLAVCHSCGSTCLAVVDFLVARPSWPCFSRASRPCHIRKLMIQLSG